MPSAPSWFSGQVRIGMDANESGATEGTGALSLRGASGAKRFMLAYNTTGNYGWMQAANFGVAFSPIHINPQGGGLVTGFVATQVVAPTIASAGTIAPVRPVSFVSGVAAISTITAPSPISITGGQITLIPTGAWTTDTAGNVAIATTAVVGKALILIYDATAAKWYPSY